jgi:hypothetical protein
MKILLKRPPGRHDQIAFTGDVVKVEHQFHPGGSRAARACGTARRAAPTRTAPRCIETYALG